MKKTILILLAFLILILPLMSAVEVDMKTEFSQGETLMAEISGNFLEYLEKENIFFYREHVKIPLDYDIAKIDDKYYVYAQLGDKTPNNYSLRIENVRYMQGVNIVEEDIIKNFVITDGLADFKVNPGFIIADEAFAIEVQNLRNFKIEIDINENKTSTGKSLFESLFSLGTFESDIELFSGEIKDLEFDLGNETSFNFIELKTENITYKIPVYVFVIETTTEEDESEEETTTEEEDESEEETTTEEDESEEETTTEEEDESEEETTIEEDEETTSDSEEKEDEIKIVSTKTCAEENGTICGDNEKCNGTIIQARDATCCLDTCQVIKKSNTGKILGWSMVIIILLIVIWFFKVKYKGAKKEINLLNIAKGKK